MGVIKGFKKMVQAIKKIANNRLNQQRGNSVKIPQRGWYKFQKVKLDPIIEQIPMGGYIISIFA